MPRVAPLALGGNVFGWTVPAENAAAILDGFVDGGGTLIDTSDSYPAWAPGCSGGESESIIGAWAAARGHRDDLVIATKVSRHPEFRGLAEGTVRSAVDASLTRLRTDRIDLLYAHYDDPERPMSDIARVFSDLVDAGKVRAIGASNFSADRLAEWIRIAHEEGLHAPVALQPHYNLVERGYETNGLCEVAEREGLAVFPYYALASGFLAGTYREQADAHASDASPRAEGAATYLDARGRAVLDALDAIAAAHDVEVATVSLAWLRQQPTVVAPIASASRPEQLPALLASMTLQLTDDELDALAQASV